MQNAQKFDNTGTIKANNTVLTTTQDIKFNWKPSWGAEAGHLRKKYHK